MDKFFYDLLNIRKSNMSYDDYSNILNKIIEEEVSTSKKDNPNLDLLCKVISNNIYLRLKEERIDSKIVNTKELLDIYEHQFVLSSYVDLDDNINYILIDPTYNQFRHKDEYDFEVIYPVDILNESIEGTNLLNNLLRQGYSKIDDNDLKRYIGSLMYERDINKIDITISDIVFERSK